MSKNKNKLGNPITVLEQQTSLRVNEIIKNVGADEGSDMEFSIMLNIITELTGTFKFETENLKLKLIENKFFTNLILTGQIFVSKQLEGTDYYEFYVIEEIKRNVYNEATEIKAKPLQDTFTTNNTTYIGGLQTFKYSPETDTWKTKGVSNSFKGVCINWNNTSYSFWIWAYPFIERIVRTHNQVDLSMKLMNKKFILWLRNNNVEVAQRLEEAIYDTKSPIITIVGPSVVNGGPQPLGQNRENLFEELKENDTNADFIKNGIEYIQFLRDSIGMVGSALPVKAERNINAEFETSDRNTNAVEETIMRNLDLLSKFFEATGTTCKIVKLRDLEKEQDIDLNNDNNGEWLGDNDNE